MGEQLKSYFGLINFAGNILGLCHTVVCQQLIKQEQEH